MTFPEFLDDHLIGIGFIVFFCLLGAKDCIKAMPPINLLPNYYACQTCPCVAPDPAEVVPNSDRDRKPQKPKGGGG